MGEVASASITAEDVYALLRARYALPSWCFLSGVRDATGWSQSRTADAIALDCYPSRGLEVHGFEIKVSRGDWLRELKDSSKSASVATYCDRWWIVAPSGVVKAPELPKAWGLITANDALRMAVQAPLLPKEPMDACFIASLVRNALQSQAERVKAAHTEGWNDGFQRGKESAERAPRETRARTAELLQAARAFEAASGIDLGTYPSASRGKRLGEAAKLAERILDHDYHKGILRAAANTAKSYAGELTEAADALDALFKEQSPPPPAQGKES